MKEDAMINGQLKPAYNLQHGVESPKIGVKKGLRPDDLII
jgi:hypothetical protein